MHLEREHFKTLLKLLKSNVLNCCLIILQQFDLLKIGLKMRDDVSESLAPKFPSEAGLCSLLKTTYKMLFSIYHFSIVHHLKSVPKHISRYWFMAPRDKKKFIIWLWKYLRGEFPCIFTEPNNCYRWFVMTSGHCFSSFSPCDGLTAIQTRNISIKSHSTCTSWAIHVCAWNATCEKS